jgi:hypothetical protein
MAGNDNISGRDSSATEPKLLTPQDVIADLANSQKDITSIIVILERGNGNSNLMWSQMEKRDLWWQVTNATMRLWNIISARQLTA